MQPTPPANRIDLSGHTPMMTHYLRATYKGA